MFFPALALAYHGNRLPTEARVNVCEKKRRHNALACACAQTHMSTPTSSLLHYGRNTTQGIPFAREEGFAEKRRKEREHAIVREKKVITVHQFAFVFVLAVMFP